MDAAFGDRKGRTSESTKGATDGAVHPLSSDSPSFPSSSQDAIQPMLKPGDAQAKMRSRERAAGTAGCSQGTPMAGMLRGGEGVGRDLTQMDARSSLFAGTVRQMGSPLLERGSGKLARSASIPACRRTHSREGRVSSSPG